MDRCRTQVYDLLDPIPSGGFKDIVGSLDVHVERYIGIVVGSATSCNCEMDHCIDVLSGDLNLLKIFNSTQYDVFQNASRPIRARRIWQVESSDLVVSLL